MEHPYPLFKREGCLVSWLDTWFVTHEEGTHHLQNWNFDREVEWCNETNTTEWESIACAELTTMITWVSESFSQKSNLITTEILNESSSYSDFSNRLISTLWAASLNIIDEEIEHLWVMKDFSTFPHNSSEHHIPLLVFEWVMKTTLRGILHAIDKRLYLI